MLQMISKILRAPRDEDEDEDEDED